jgi:RND family efflux transporter MFP subunit
MSTKDKLKKIGLPLLIVLIGFAVMQIFILVRPAPQKEAKDHLGVLAEVMTVQMEDRRIEVTGTGTVQARQEANITPQVSGRITHIAPNFIAGGFFKEGDLLFKIENVDYKLAVDRSRAAVAQAEFELAQEESNARVARNEWERLAKDKEEEPNPLVVYEPQLKRARANVASARAAVRQAELDLQRTALKAPFNCRVRSEEIDLGQYVRSGNSAATVAGTETAEIVVPLPLEELYWLSIPRQGSKVKGSPATVKVAAGDQTFIWEGNVVRSLGEVDPRGRMARVVVAVDDPYHLKKSNGDGVPDLEFGMFVEVAIQGDMLTGVFSIPRGALRQDDTVWVVGEEEKLQIRKINVVRRDRETVLIRNDLKEGDRVILTALQGAANGMKLRPREQGAIE